MSNVGAINTSSYYTPAADTSAKTSAAENTKEAAETAETAKTDKTAKEGVVYEKGSSTVNTSYVKQNSALIEKLKADADARVSQMRSLVEKMMSQQGAAIGNADSMWSFLASGKFTVSADVKAQAQKDIADDGYWGVEQTSDRIVDFAKALSGNDASKADKMIEAFKKGFEQATGSWGKELPDISSRTYDAVMKKLDEWKNGTATEAEASTTE